jgi:hypothetical protein
MYADGILWEKVHKNKAYYPMAIIIKEQIH